MAYRTTSNIVQNNSQKNKFYNEVAMIYVAQKCGFEVKER